MKVRTLHDTGANIILIVRSASIRLLNTYWKILSKEFLLKIFADDFDELGWDGCADHNLVVSG